MKFLLIQNKFKVTSIIEKEEASQYIEEHKIKVESLIAIAEKV